MTHQWMLSSIYSRSETGVEGSTHNEWWWLFMLNVYCLLLFNCRNSKNLQKLQTQHGLILPHWDDPPVSTPLCWDQESKSHLCMIQHHHNLLNIVMKMIIKVWTNLMLPIINTCDPMVKPLTACLSPGNDVIGDQVFFPTLFTSHELSVFEPSYPPQTRFI